MTKGHGGPMEGVTEKAIERCYNLIGKFNQFKRSRDLFRQVKMWINGTDRTLDLYWEIKGDAIAFQIQSFLSK